MVGGWWQEAAQTLLEQCLRSRRWSDDVLRQLVEEALDADPARARAASQALFGVLVEGLADRFEARLCDVYAELFAQVVARARPEVNPAELVERYQRIRKPRAFGGNREEVRQVFVLSRVTLGADIAVTSPILDGLKQAFPAAEIRLVAGSKNQELFAADPRIKPRLLGYDRTGLLRDKLEVWPRLRAVVNEPGSIVVDPDSRLTQLGLLPVCPEDRYFFFESRSYGGEGDEPLGLLAGSWVEETFGVRGWPYLALRPEAQTGPRAQITVSLGVGGNLAKRLPDPFEAELLRGLAALGAVVVDKGGDEEEARRVEAAAAACGSSRVETFEGSFAEFACRIAQSRLFVGYDSAAGHAAAALGTPVVSVFAGAASDRMRARWRPFGRGPVELVPADGRRIEGVLRDVLRHSERLLGWASGA